MRNRTNIPHYGTAQLQDNVLPDASCMYFRCIPHEFRTCPVSGKEGRGTHIHLAAALSRGFALARTRLVHIPGASCARFRHILHAF